VAFYAKLERDSKREGNRDDKEIIDKYSKIPPSWTHAVPHECVQLTGVSKI
jgi:hypothetical protein